MGEFIGQHRNGISFVFCLVVVIIMLMFRKGVLYYDKEKFENHAYYRMKVRKERFTYWLCLVVIFIMTLHFMVNCCAT
jgi:hypothetical protein